MMADMPKEDGDGGETKSPSDTSSAPTSSTTNQEEPSQLQDQPDQKDLQSQLDEALNLTKIKEDEIVRLMHLCNSYVAKSDCDWSRANAAEKEVEHVKLCLQAEKVKVEQVTLLLQAEQAKVKSLESRIEMMEVEKNKGRMKRLLQAKCCQVEKLKKAIGMKDILIKHQAQKLSQFQAPDENDDDDVKEEVSSNNNSPSPEEVDESMELESELVDEQNNSSVDFVEELLQDCPSPATMDKSDDTSEHGSDSVELSFSDDPNDQDYQPSPNLYRNKIVKKLRNRCNPKEVRIRGAKRSSTTNGNGVLECPVCPPKEDGTRQIYSGITGLNYHMSINHPDHPGFKTERFKCSDCPDIFVRKQDLEKHLKTAHLEVRYKCKYCTKSFSSPHYCHHHEKLHKKTGGGPAVLTCNKCFKVFSSELGLRQHQVTKHPHGVGEYKCRHCNTTFMHLTALRMHITTNHRSKPLKCPHCPRSYTKRGGLRRHIQIAHSTGTENQVVKPEVSGVGGGRRHSIEAKRQLLVYLESKGYLASQSVNSVMAEFIPGYIPNLREITVDSPEEMKCPYCEMEFGENQGRQFKIHLSRHRFKCIRCVDVFDQASSLRYHLSVTHKIEGEEAEELVKEGVIQVKTESQTSATKYEPFELADLLE